MNANEYLIVNKSVLPDYFEKVVEVRNLLKAGKAKDVTEAVRIVGISRSTYYKYKDVVFKAADQGTNRRAVISMLLYDRPGILSKVLNKLSENGANVFTISQNPPIMDRAIVVISITVENLACGVSELLAALAELDGVENPSLIDMA